MPNLKVWLNKPCLLSNRLYGYKIGIGNGTYVVYVFLFILHCLIYTKVNIVNYNVNTMV